jgi:hypothetical protein
VSQQTTIEVFDKDGWQRTYPLEKPIVYIGSDPGNDVVLEQEHGQGVAPLHAQLIGAVENGGGYRLINLADTEIWLDPEGDQTVPPRSAIDVAADATFILGQFTLVFKGAVEVQRGVTAMSSGERIGLTLKLPQTRLAPGKWLEGVATVSNLSQQTGVQFEMALEGLPQECFDIEPGPLLSSGAEKDVIFRLYHRNNQPLAGEHRIRSGPRPPGPFRARKPRLQK